MSMDTRFRSFAKSVSWRIVAALVTFAISMFVTRNVTFAITISVFEAVGKVFLFYFHERLWLRIPIGRHEIADLTVPPLGATEVSGPPVEPAPGTT
jgi:uncharacterized membrane protein